jgi:hypothetical protein
VLTVVAAVALAVTVLATLVGALRAARASTVLALPDAARQPRRRAWLIGYSARLPVPLLVAVRLTARRPRRVLLSAGSIAVTISGIVAVLFAHATLAVSQFGTSSGTASPGRLDVGFISQTTRQDQVLLIVTILLVALAAVNVIFITRATVQDSWRASAVTAPSAPPQSSSPGDFRPRRSFPPWRAPCSG